MSHLSPRVPFKIEPSLTLDEPTIPVSCPRLFATELGLQEKSLADLLWRTGVDHPQFLFKNEAKLTINQYIQVVRNALRLSGDSAFGLRMGKRITPLTLGPLGFLISSSPDLQTALDSYRNFLPTRIPISHITSRQNGTDLEYILAIDVEVEEPLYRCIMETFSLSLISIVEFILARPLNEGHLYCNFPKPDYYSQYREYTHCPASFSAKEHKLVIPLEFCNSKNSYSDHCVYDVALKQCQDITTKIKSNADTTVHRVQTVLLSHPQGKLTESEVATALFISKRTLARRLQKENTSFREIQEHILSQMASDYLLNTKLPVETIAYLLNYHDGANFRRAFQRWYGTTPSEYRKVVT